MRHQVIDLSRDIPSMNLMDRPGDEVVIHVMAGRKHEEGRTCPVCCEEFDDSKRARLIHDEPCLNSICLECFKRINYVKRPGFRARRHPSLFPAPGCPLCRGTRPFTYAATNKMIRKVYGLARVSHASKRWTQVWSRAGWNFLCKDVAMSHLAVPDSDITIP